MFEDQITWTWTIDNNIYHKNANISLNQIIHKQTQRLNTSLAEMETL